MLAFLPEGYNNVSMKVMAAGKTGGIFSFVRSLYRKTESIPENLSAASGLLSLQLRCLACFHAQTGLQVILYLFVDLSNIENCSFDIL